MGELIKVGDGKAVMFEIDPDEPSELAGLGAILTSFEDPTNAGVGALDQILPGGPYCFTGLKVTVLTTITEDTPIQPTPTKLIPVLYKSEGDTPTLVLNQYARLPEIIHGDEEGEIEVAKLTVDEAVVENTDTTNLLVKNQLIVGEGDANILTVAQNNNKPIIEVKQAPVIIKTRTDTEETKALSVTGGAEIKQSLTVAGGKFVTTNTGETTIKNNLTIKDTGGTAETFKVIANDGNTTIAGTLSVGPDSTNPRFKVSDTNTEVNTSSFTAKSIKVTDSAGSTDSATGALVVAGGVGIGENLNVGGDLSAKTTSITGNLIVKDSSNGIKFSITDVGTPAKTKTTIATDSAEITGSTTIGGTLEVTDNTTITGTLNTNGDLSVNTDKFTVSADDGDTDIAGALSVAGDLTVLNTKTDTSTFSVAAGTGNTTIAGTLNVAESVNLVGDNVTIGTDLVTIKTATQIEDTLVTTGTLTANYGVHTTALTVTGAGNPVVDITEGGLSVKGEITGKSTLEVSDTATVQALSIKSGATAAVSVIDSSRNLKNITKATVGELWIRPEGREGDKTDPNPFVAGISSEGNLVARSVKPNILFVPAPSGGTVTRFSLGPATVEAGDEAISSAKAFYFDDTEYTLTPTAAKQDLIDLIYPIGSIYMTMDNKDPKDLFGGTWEQIAGGKVLLGADDNFNAGVTGGYYDPQPWAHSHKYSKAHTSTEDTALLAKHMPRHTHTGIIGYAGQHGHQLTLTGTTHDRTVSKCNCIRVASTTDGAAITYDTKTLDSKDSNNKIWLEIGGTHKHSITVGLTGGDDAASEAGNGIGHNHKIGLKENTDTTGNPSTQPNGNLPPYLVCYIWQRIA